MGRGIWEHGLWNMECGFMDLWNVEDGVWNMETGFMEDGRWKMDLWNMKHGIWNMEYGV